MTQRLIVGDIHGCYRELEQLVDKAGLAASDEIIALGDLVDRGPDSPRVLAFFRQTPNAYSLKGNHERKHVRGLRGQTRPALSQRITRRQLGEPRYRDACAFFHALPLYLELPEAILVHGYLEPGKQLAEQRETVLTGTMAGEAYLRKHYREPWYELYDGIKPVVVGHKNYLGTREPFRYKDRVIGLDTGCCTGGALTGLILPEFRVITIESRGDYWSEQKRQHADLRFIETPENSLSWSSLNLLLSGHEHGEPGIQERLHRLTRLSAEAEEALGRLRNLIDEECRAVVRALRRQADFDVYSEQEQAKAFAGYLETHPRAGWIKTSWLYQARRGTLSVEGLRKHFKKPAEVIAFVKRVGLERE